MSETKREMSAFMKQVRLQGWTAKTLAEHWGYSSSQSISQMAANPKRKHYDMLKGAGMAPGSAGSAKNKNTVDTWEKIKTLVDDALST